MPSWFHVRVPARDTDNLKLAVEQAAAHDHMSPSDWIRRALRQAIERQREEITARKPVPYKQIIEGLVDNLSKPLSKPRRKNRGKNLAP